MVPRGSFNVVEVVVEVRVEDPGEAIAGVGTRGRSLERLAASRLQQRMRPDAAVSAPLGGPRWTARVSEVVPVALRRCVLLRTFGHATASGGTGRTTRSLGVMSESCRMLLPNR